MTNPRFQHLALALSIMAVAGLLQACDRSVPKADSTDQRASLAGDHGAAVQSMATVPVVAVASGILSRDVDLPGQILPFRDVRIHAKVRGYISQVNVDRGSHVKRGQVLLTLCAPELDAQCDELSAKVVEAKAAQAEAHATLEADHSAYTEIKTKLDADVLTLQRLRQASTQEPGSIAQNEIDIAQKTVEGDGARLKAAEDKVRAAEAVVAAKLKSVEAAQDSLKSLEATRDYLVIRAPLDGIITERWVHEGDFAGVEMQRGENARPLLRLVETSKLRLVVAVPESAVAGIHEGQKIAFAVPAHLGRQFYGTVARVGHALDVNTRTMPVELDVSNQRGELEPGMYGTVKWHEQRPYPTLFVPNSAVGSNLERTFVVRVSNGIATVIRVKTGHTIDDSVEIAGDIHEGDQVILKASDEYKDGVAVVTKIASAEEIKSACRSRSSSGGE